MKGRALVAAALLTGAAAISSCAAPSTPPPHLRSATVLELATTAGAWTGLDPLTNTSASINHDFFNAIYGRLFHRGVGSEIVPELATGFTVSPNQLEVDLTLRPGVTFSDGTPFDTAAVAYNLTRDLAPTSGCRCLANFAAVSSVAAVGQNHVALHLSRPDPSIIEAFIDAAPNWIVSPTALQRLGETGFSDMPVGAGPFVVIADHLNSSLVLAANPRYWHAGYPKLDQLTFTSVTDDATAYQALRVGQAQIYMAFGTPALLTQMSSLFQVVPTPATQTEAVNLNPQNAPFTNLSAREAIYYATDAEAINKYIFKGAGTVSQTPGGPADLYWSPTVPGYRAHDPERAKSLVRSLGGLSFTLSALNTPIQVEIAEALKSQWAQTGITASISLISIPQAIQQSHTGTLQAIITQVGTYNPKLVPGLAASYASTGPFSLIKDPQLDDLITRAAAETDPAAATAAYQQVYARLSAAAYAPFLFTMNQWNVAAPPVRGLTPTNTEVDWENIALE